MTSRKAPLWLPLLLLALFAGALFFVWKQKQDTMQREAALSRLQEENRALAARAAGRPAEPPAPAEAPPTADRTPGHAAPTAAETAARLDSVRMLSQVKDQLTTARTSIAELQDRVRELEAASEKAIGENKQHAQAESELRESLASANRVVTAMQAELKSKTDRLAALETGARRTTDDMRTANDKITKMATLARDLEDINRRRDLYLNNLMRRYRDLTDQVRAMTIRLDNTDETPRRQTVDLPRLQNTVQLAEEDLRQLTSLNSQAATITQKMRN